MINPKLMLGTLALLATVCWPIAATNAATYNWSFSDVSFGGTNSGSGTLTTGAASAFPGGFDITSITGKWNGQTITPTTPDATFQFADNVFYPNGCSSSSSACVGGSGGFFIDQFGIAFDTSTLQVSIFECCAGGSGGYFDLTSHFLSGTQGLFSATATPRPAALPLFATGIGAMGLIGWRRKRKAQAVG